MAISTVGLAQAIIDAIGESDNDIGGINQTRLIALTSAEQVLSAPFTWDGTAVVLTPDTSGVQIGDYIRLSEGGIPFQIESFVSNVSVTVTVPSGQTVPIGPPTTGIGTGYTWNGTTTVTSSDTSEVGVGQWIRLDTDGQWFEVTAVDPNVSVTVANPFSLTIPSGATSSSRSGNPVTVKVPNSLSVETVVGWEDSGTVTVEGAVYAYATRTLSPPTLGGITHDLAGVTTPGLRRDHRELAPVTDTTKARSAVDLARRGMLVDFAEGEDLNALGRNLGVLRFPFLESDDVFREVVKALAYNPKGTIYGLELALDALVGRGNYEIFEDLITFPCTVFIRNLQGPFTSEGSEGKAFLTGDELQPATSATTVDIDNEVVTRGAVHGVTFADEDHLSDFRAQLPSAETIEEYPGDPGTQAWYFQGSSEVTEVTQLSNNQGIQISTLSTQCRYERVVRIQPDSYASISMLMFVDPLANIQSLAHRQWGAEIEDGAQVVSWGTDFAGAGIFTIGLTSGADSYVAGSAITLTTNTYYDVEIRKFGTSVVELYVDGSLVQSAAYSLFTTSSSSRTTMRFGVHNKTITGIVGRIKQVGFVSQTITDYWGARGNAGDTNVANPTRLDVNIAAFFLDPTDIGKRVVIRNGTVLNAQGGSNNGIYQIASVVGAPSDQVELEGESFIGAAVNADLNPLRVRVDDEGQQFTFPDDLGKTLVISGSDQGNNGSYTIDKLLDSETLTDLESFATTLEQRTNVCEVTAATFVTESGLTYRVDPAFETEASVEWEASDMGSVSGTTLTLRQALPTLPAGVVAPAPTRVLAVRYSDVLSAQILMDVTITNTLLATLPSLVFSYYPFYLSDPLAFIRNYVDDVTAAGVIPEFAES